ncbi:MAG: uL15 family ribosomal protein [Candidatus Altiarchaeota archaeon]|nr:uL15 family ribosomal protein [Candidatus Altiarchaeota archaeon]
MAHKDRKTRKMRGTRTHGFGNTQKHRGAGSRGGRGMAGSKKHKWMHISKFFPGYFGRSGFKRPQCQVDDKVIINISDLDENVDSLVKSGFLKKDKDSYSANLTEHGVDKLLGTGKASHKFILTVGECSEKARQKIEEAGGKVVLPEAAAKEGKPEHSDTDD